MTKRKIEYPLNVLVVGFGFVGKAYAIYLRERGHVVDVLTDGDKTGTLALDYGFDKPYPNQEYEACIIAIPTPTVNDKIDLSCLKKVINTVTSDYHVKRIFLKSTIIPGTTDSFQSKFKDVEFYFYPEFLESSNPLAGVFNQKIKVFGHGFWTQQKKDWIESFFGFKASFTDTVTAETLKYVHNLWLCSNISFWNSMKKLNPNADFDFVLSECHKSDYFGRHPWIVGSAFDGHCLPKDLSAFIGFSKNGVFKDFLKQVVKVNDEMKKKESK